MQHPPSCLHCWAAHAVSVSPLHAASLQAAQCTPAGCCEMHCVSDSTSSWQEGMRSPLVDVQTMLDMHEKASRLVTALSL